MKLMGALALIALLAGCGAAAPTPSPTPTPAPSPTPLIIYVTPSPTAVPTASPTENPTATLAAAHDIAITFTLHGNPFGTGREIAGNDTVCWGDGGYSDINTGMQATIYDATGTVIGFATFRSDGQTTETYNGSPTACSFGTTALGVPDASLYGIEVGRRGTVQFARSDLAASGWLAELSLGQ